MPLIYALGDPRTNEIRYIGKTNNVYRRYVEHLNYSHPNGAKDAWMNEIKQARLLPTLVILEDDIDESTILEREEYWIEQYLSQGAPLTNVARIAPLLLDSSPQKESPRKLTKIRLRVYEVARSKGVGQGKLARMADMDMKTLKRIYKDPYADISIWTLSKLANALNVDARELLESVPDE